MHSFTVALSRWPCCPYSAIRRDLSSQRQEVAFNLTSSFTWWIIAPKSIGCHLQQVHGTGALRWNHWQEYSPTSWNTGALAELRHLHQVIGPTPAILSSDRQSARLDIYKSLSITCCSIFFPVKHRLIMRPVYADITVNDKYRDASIPTEVLILFQSEIKLEFLLVP